MNRDGMSTRAVSRTSRALSVVAAAVPGYLLVCTFWSPAIPASASLALCALAVGAAWKPEGTLLLLAAALPVVSYATRALPAPGFLWPVALMASYACGYFVQLALRGRTGSADPTLRRAVLTLTALICAAVIVELPAVEVRLGAPAFRAELLHMFGPGFFIARSTTPGIAAGVLLLEGLLMLWVSAALARASEPFRRAMPRAIVLGATLAAVANVGRLADVAGRRAAPLVAFFSLVAAQRVNVHYLDLNAAGSFFVLALCVSIVLARRRAGWWVTSGLLALALWMSGSRAALLAGVGAAAVPFLRPVLARFRARAWVGVAAIGVAVLVAILAGAWLLPERGNQKSAATAIEVRVELARTSLDRKSVV